MNPWSNSVKRSLIVTALVLLGGSPLLAQRVLVFPLAQTSGPVSASWIGTGLAVALDESLTQGGVPNIPYDNLKRLFEQEGLVENPSFDLPAAVALARQLGAGVLFFGRYSVTDAALSVHLDAYDLRGNLKRLDGWDERESLQGLLDLTGKLGHHVFTVLDKPWAGPPKVSPQAFESYIRGRISQDPLLQEVYFRKAVELQPDYDDAKCCLAVVLKDTGRVTESAGILEALEKKSYPKAYLGLLTLAEIRMESGRLIEARRLLMASLKASESPEAHVDLAKLNLRQKKFKEAQAELVMAERFGTHQEEIDALRAQIDRESAAAAQPKAPEAPKGSSTPAGQVAAGGKP
jgi:tetratricopeptide (TPR) repeat protein